MRCELGNHDALLVETTRGIAHCPVHPLDPAPAADRPVIGRCTFGHGPEPVWTVPRYGKPYCARHLRRLLYIASYPNPVVYPDIE